MIEKRYCVGCGKLLLQRHKIKYCSNKCQIDHQHTEWVRLWEKGTAHGNIGITARNISVHLRKYLLEKFGNKCALCGWNKVNPTTGSVPLEVDHIDGNAENNLESNLQVLCPNCHALTPFFKNLNKGKGRAWRTKKYIKN